MRRVITALVDPSGTSAEVGRVRSCVGDWCFDIGLVPQISCNSCLIPSRAPCHGPFMHHLRGCWPLISCPQWAAGSPPIPKSQKSATLATKVLCSAISNVAVLPANVPVCLLFSRWTDGGRHAMRGSVSGTHWGCCRPAVLFSGPPTPGCCFNFHSGRGGGPPLDPLPPSLVPPPPPPPSALIHLRIRVLGTFFRLGQFFPPAPLTRL